MQLVASRTAQEYNLRKNRNGAFWEDRYHATAVQSGRHLIRCLVYIDLNMVRAGAVAHPHEWDISGYSEMQEPRSRKGVIDHGVLHRLCDIESLHKMQRAHRAWIAESIGATERNPIWTESAAVGDTDFLNRLRIATGLRDRFLVLGLGK
jgi:putative transposase